MTSTHNHHLYGPSAPATVVLDIGGEIGALIIEACAEHAGLEIEISPTPLRADDPEPVRTHSMVRERTTTPPTYDAVYPELREGAYTVWRESHVPAGTVTIVGGQISRFAFSEGER